jgi:hypothetical protein
MRHAPTMSPVMLCTSINDHLIDDALMAIFQQLRNGDDVHRCRLVCRRWNAIIADSLQVCTLGLICCFTVIPLYCYIATPVHCYTIAQLRRYCMN